VDLLAVGLGDKHLDVSRKWSMGSKFEMEDDFGEDCGRCVRALGYR
jgi:hypothetical protein